MLHTRESRVTTMLASDVEGLSVFGRGGAELGVLEHLLYHPSAACVIGASVRPPAAMVVVKRMETFLPLESLEIVPGGVAVDLAKLPGQRAAAAGLGHDPELTVIWTGMPVAGPSGEQLGTVTDVEFDLESGEVRRMEVAGGAIADAAHGRYLVPGDAVLGYSAGAVRITREAGELEASGGLAKSAAIAAAAAARKAAEVGQAVEDTVVAASGAAGRAIKAVSDARVAQKAAKRVRSTWRDSVNAFKDGMKDE